MSPRNLVTLKLILAVSVAGPPLAAQSQGHSSELSGAPIAFQGVGDLPLSLSPAPAGPMLAVVLSGDGGWAAGDKSLAKAFVAERVAVVGLNSPRYLEQQRTPEEAGSDLARILRHFLSTWNRERAVVVGYSRGADIGPFMVSRLPADLRAHVAMLVLLGPGEQASFRFNMLDIARSHHGDPSLPVEPEVAKLRDLPVLCIYGETDRGAICQALDQARLAHAMIRNGGHVVHGDEGPTLAKEILAQLLAFR